MSVWVELTLWEHISKVGAVLSTKSLTTNGNWRQRLSIIEVLLVEGPWMLEGLTTVSGRKSGTYESGGHECKSDSTYRSE